MNTRQRTISIGLATIIFLGGLIEVMKSSRDTSSTLAGRKSGIFGMSLDQLDNEDSPALTKRPAREAAERARSRLSGRLSGRIGGELASDRSQRLGGKSDGTAPTATPSGNGETPTLGDPKKINTADTSKKRAEEDRKKKKKKKKKKTDSAKGPNVDVTVTERDEEYDEAGEAPIGAGALSLRSAVAAKEMAAEKEREAKSGELNSLEDWLAYMMPQPNYERTMKLLQELQSKRLEPGIFHEVVSEMLSDPRLQMQELGVLALGSYPSLRSYLALQAANLRFSESSSLKIQSRSFLKSYSRVENLRYLSSVLTARVEADVVFEALRLIHSSANFYSGQVKSTSGGSTNTPQPAATPASVVRQFTPLVPVLNRLAQTSTDETIRQEASSTLRQVQILTGST